MPDGPAPLAPPTIAAILTDRGLLSGAALERVRRLESETGERIDRIAAKLGLVADRDLAAAYAALLGAAVVEATDFPAELVAADRLTATFLRHARVVPLAETDTDLCVAMADPLDEADAGALAFALGKPITRRAALPAELEAQLERLYGDGRSATERAAAETGERPDEDRDASARHPPRPPTPRSVPPAPPAR